MPAYISRNYPTFMHFSDGIHCSPPFLFHLYPRTLAAEHRRSCPFPQTSQKETVILISYPTVYRSETNVCCKPRLPEKARPCTPVTMSASGLSPKNHRFVAAKSNATMRLGWELCFRTHFAFLPYFWGLAKWLVFDLIISYLY